MTETDWELKDRRIGWMNCNTNAAAMIQALAVAGAFKGKDEEYIRKQFEQYRGIDYASFLDLNGGADKQHLPEEKPGEPERSIGSSSQPKEDSFFKKPAGSPASPKKKKKGFACSECLVPIEEKVKDYSERNFGRALCYKHQDEERDRREKIENANGPKDVLF